MAENGNRKHKQTIDYVDNEVGADIPRNLKRVAIVEVDSQGGLDTNIAGIGGQPQSAVDVANRIDQIQSILAGQVLTIQEDSPVDVSAAEVDVDLNSQALGAVTVTDDGSLQVDGVVAVQQDSPLDVSGAEVDVDLTSQSLGAVTVTDDGSLVLDAANQGTLPVEQQSAVAVEASDDGGNTSQLQAGELGTGLGGVETALVTKLAEALSTVANAQVRVDIQNNNAGTLPVEQQTPVGIEDSTGAQIDPPLGTDYLDSQTTGYDLVGSGDLTIGPEPVARGTGVVIAAQSTDNNAFSVSVEWQDGNGNVFQSESATDIGLDAITGDYARLVRKGPQVAVTVTDDSGGAQNNINIHADTER